MRWVKLSTLLSVSTAFQVQYLHLGWSTVNTIIVCCDIVLTSWLLTGEVGKHDEHCSVNTFQLTLFETKECKKKWKCVGTFIVFVTSMLIMLFQYFFDCPSCNYEMNPGVWVISCHWTLGTTFIRMLSSSFVLYTTFIWPFGAWQTIPPSLMSAVTLRHRLSLLFPISQVKPFIAWTIM